MKKPFIIFIVPFLLFGAFCVKAQISETGTVNVSALVPETGQGGGGIIPFDLVPPVISEIEVIEIGSNSARINWKTNELSVPQINYGESSSYSKTYIGESFSINNSILLENLLSGATYHFEIAAIDRAGNRISSGDLAFETLFPFDIVPPANINLFTAGSFEGKIVLSWNNPTNNDFTGVQINKSVDSPALNSQSGEIIYSGTGESFEDANVKNGIRYFYAAFSYDGAGNFSSGTIVSAVGIKTAKPPIEPSEPPVIPPEIIPYDVENLEAVSDSGNKEIEIKWDSPGNEDFEEVEIYKSKDFPILAPGEGEIAYKGKGNSFKDKNIEKGEVYYYTAFIKDKSGKYSAGKSVAGTLEKLPISTISGISMNDANFVFSEEALLLPQRDDKKIHTFPSKEINIYYDSKNLPKTLKTIAITVGRSSYILGSDGDNKFYKAKFISPQTAGIHPLTISVLDFRAGKIFQAKGELVVEDYGKVCELKIKDYESKNFFEKIVSSFKFQVSRVFDSGENLNLYETGVDNATVTLYKFDENSGEWSLWGAKKYNQENPQLTDKSGSFGFMVPNGKYKISIRKSGYYSKEENFDVKNNLMNGEFEIRKEPDWTLPLLIALAILALAFIVWRKIRRRKKGSYAI